MHFVIHSLIFTFSIACCNFCSDAEEFFHADYIPDSWKTTIDTSWPRAHGIGSFDTAQPWLNRSTNRDTYIRHGDAKWIWTDNPGMDGANTDGDKNVFCNVQLPLECGGRKSMMSRFEKKDIDLTRPVISRISH